MLDGAVAMGLTTLDLAANPSVITDGATGDS